MKNPIPCLLLFALMLSPAVDAGAAEAVAPPALPPPPPPRKVAIFVKNNTDPRLNDKVPFLEDLVASKVTSPDYSIISREDVLKAIRIHPTDRPTEPDRNALGTKVDRLLSDTTSALRLAENMDADFILLVSMNPLGKTVSKFRDADLAVARDTTLYALRVTWKLTEGVTGGSLISDTVSARKAVAQSENLGIESDDFVNELLEDAAAKVAAGFAAKARDFKMPVRPERIEISVVASPRDLTGNEISVPDLRMTEDNHVVRGEAVLPVYCVATIEVDGIAVGSTGRPQDKLKVRPGKHTLRLSRAGFEPVVRTIEAQPGAAFAETMQMTEEAYGRWKDLRAFLTGLDSVRELSSARAEEVRGNAQRLRQSGFLVNTTNAPTINILRSIYDW
jgi:hypothetical protein